MLERNLSKFISETINCSNALTANDVNSQNVRGFERIDRVK